MRNFRRSKAAGQATLPFGTANDPVYARKACLVTVMTPRLAIRLLQGTDMEGTRSDTFMQLVSIYAKAMKSLWWMLTGETIVVDRNGRVIDGKARLQACVEANMPFPVVLVTGLEPGAEYGIDDRKTRSKADTLYIRGERRPQSVVHACEMIVGYLHAPNRSLFVAGGKVEGLDNHGISRLVARYPEISASARHVDGLTLPGFSHATLTAAHFLMEMLDKEKATRFFEVLRDPSLDPKGVPARLATKAKPKLTDGKDTKALAILAQCWQAFRMGERFHRKLLTYDGRVEGDPSGLAGFPDWGLAPSDRLTFETIDPPVSVPSEIASGGPDVVEEHLRSKLAKVDVTAEFFTLDVAHASEFLGINNPNGSRNRRISRTHVESLKTDILAARWHSNGQSIKVSRHPALMDGQHRCTAVVETGIPIEVVLVRGLHDLVFPALDGGIRKTYAQRERAKGAYANERSAALKVIARIEANDEDANATPNLQVEIAARYPDMEEAVEGSGTAGLVAPAVAAALFAILGAIDMTRTREFFGKLASGANLNEGDPVYVLREKLLLTGRSKARDLHARHARWLIHAWNAFVEGRPLTRLRNAKGPGFPTISKG